MRKFKSGTDRIAGERARQVAVEGFSPEHDLVHDQGELVFAAACYLLEGHMSIEPSPWPWSEDWWKPSEDRVRNLEKAGALIAAEIDRLENTRLENM